MSVGIRKAFDAVELGDGGLIDEEWDTEPALFGLSSALEQLSKRRRTQYQSEEVFDPPICRSVFGEDGYCDCPSEENDETLDAVEDDFRFLEDVVWESHCDCLNLIPMSRSIMYSITERFC